MLIYPFGIAYLLAIFRWFVGYLFIVCAHFYILNMFFKRTFCIPFGIAYVRRDAIVSIQHMHDVLEKNSANWNNVDSHLNFSSVVARNLFLSYNGNFRIW